MNSQRNIGMMALVSNPGALDQRVTSATGMSYQEFLAKMNDKEQVPSVDLMFETGCSGYSCTHCFFDERAKAPSSRSDVAVNLDELSRRFNVALYPRDGFGGSRWWLRTLPSIGQGYLATNGIALGERPELVAELLGAGVTSVVLSIHGRPDVHGRLTGLAVKRFPLISKAVRILQEHGIAVSASSSFFAENEDDADWIADWLLENHVRHWTVARTLPLGRARGWPESRFLRGGDAGAFLGTVGGIRSRVKKEDLYVSIDPSFGPNFYTKSIYRFLAGMSPHEWATWKYVCAVPTRGYAGVSLDSGAIVPCFMFLGDEGVGLAEIRGSVPDMDDVANVVARWMQSMSQLSGRMRGLCALGDCKYSEICMGGCRAAAFAWARRYGESEPMWAGVDFCLTREIDRIVDAEVRFEKT